MRAFDEFRAAAREIPGTVQGRKIWGGIAPHAGWRYSGATAWQVFQALAAGPKPETVILFATSHRGDVSAPSLQSNGIWKTPVGDVEIDAELARKLLALAKTEDYELLDRAEAHENDHAIEVLLPILKVSLPDARFIPVAMPFRANGTTLGALVAQAAKQLGRTCVALASTDLTHYGPNYYDFAPQGTGMGAHRWSKEVNDRAFLDQVLKLEPNEAAKIARRDRSACGPAAAASAIEFSKQNQAREGVLLEHVTSWERGKDGEPCDFVGYAGVVFI
jgi:AmmeMemoRadiSam system protein B